MAWQFHQATATIAIVPNDFCSRCFWKHKLAGWQLFFWIEDFFEIKLGAGLCGTGGLVAMGGGIALNPILRDSNPSAPEGPPSGACLLVLWTGMCSSSRQRDFAVASR